MKASASSNTLYPNQFINARLRVDVRRGALTVPAAAVQHGSQGTYVYVVGSDSTVEMKPVTVDLSEGTIDVLSGEVHAGEQVVVDGADKVQPHAKVQVAGPAGGGGRGAAGGRRGSQGPGAAGPSHAGHAGKRAAS